MTMTFEEFLTAQQRQRSTEAAEQPEKKESTTITEPKIETILPPQTDSTSTSNRWTAWRDHLKVLIEDPNIQILILILINLDILLGTWHLTSQLTDNSSPLTQWLIPLPTLRKTTIYLQLVELLLQMTLFHIRFFSHWGYAIDSFLIAARTLHRHDMMTMNATKDIITRNTYYLQAQHFRIAWRFLRLIQTYISIEVVEHNVTKKELSRRTTEMEEFQTKAMLLEEDVSRERELRIQNEEVTKECREEVETLREALNIAAADVALAWKEGGKVDIVEFHDSREGAEDDDIKAWVTHPANFSGITA
mmetsp:Transcript_12552/g.26712  ORF Transcript_12552/g.26712 Transcript_12552/m.26712 type:complete len:305 (+) Transcript_12552:122-1036(+)